MKGLLVFIILFFSLCVIHIAIKSYNNDIKLLKKIYLNLQDQPTNDSLYTKNFERQLNSTFDDSLTTKNIKRFFNYFQEQGALVTCVQSKENRLKFMRKLPNSKENIIYNFRLINGTWKLDRVENLDIIYHKYRCKMSNRKLSH
jgi:hypothetical protein